MSPDFAEQARHAFDRDDHMPDTRAPIPEPPHTSLYWVTALIVGIALALTFGAIRWG